jgi:hypothetical protein
MRLWWVGGWKIGILRGEGVGVERLGKGNGGEDAIFAARKAREDLSSVYRSLYVS